MPWYRLARWKGLFTNKYDQYDDPTIQKKVVKRVKNRKNVYSVHVIDVKTGVKLHEIPFYETPPSKN